MGGRAARAPLRSSNPKLQGNESGGDLHRWRPRRSTHSRSNPVSQSHTPRPSGKQTEQPQALQLKRGQAQRELVDGHWPSGHDYEDLDIDVANDAAAAQPQTETQSSNKNEKKSEPIDVDDTEPVKKETPAAQKTEVNKTADVAKNAAVDAGKKKDDEDDPKKVKIGDDEEAEKAAKKKADDDAKAKKAAEAKRHEDCSNQLIQPL